MLACQAARSFAIWTGKEVPGGIFLEYAKKGLIKLAKPDF
jgi:shikimate 5-dehydrogenase